MSNEKFKVKFGLAVGDTQATIDGSNGDISTLGDIDIKGGGITNSTGALSITTASNGDLTLDPNGTGQVVVNSAIDVNGNITGDLLTIDNIQIDGNTVSATTGILTLSTTAGSNNVLIDPSSGTTVNDGHLILGQLNTAAILITNGTGGLSIRTGSYPTSANIGLTDGANGDITIDTDGTGQVIINAQLDVNGNILADNLQIDNININGNTISSTDTNGNLLLSPNGTGQVHLVASSTQIGTGSANAQITTSGAYDMTLSTNNGTNSGTITIANGVNGAVTLAPNGTGNIVATLANGGNLTNIRNYVFGAVRNATTLAAGDIWALNAATATQPFRGITVDNSADTTKNAGYVARNYSATAGNRSRFVFERARGTAAAPTAVQSGDTVGSVEVTGCNANGVFISDGLQGTATAVVPPGILSFAAAETWSAGTGTGPIFGTTFLVQLAPSATAITSGATLVPIITANPQTFACRSDAYTWSNGKTGSTQRMSLDVSGNLIVSGDVRINGNDIQASDGNTNISLTSNTLTTFAGDVRINGNDIQGSGGSTAITLTSANTSTTVVGDTFNVNNAGGINYFQTFKDGSNHIAASVNQTRATTGDEFALINFTTQRSADGINFTPTLNNDVIGSFKFNGNANTSTSPGVPAGPGAQIYASATENWTALVNGTKINFNVIKKGAITDVDVISAASDATTFKSDVFTFKDSSSTTYATLNSTSATFAQPVGFPVKTVAQWGAISGVAGQQVCVSNSSTSPTQTEDSMMAYWGTTATAGWKYIHDNRAI